MRCPYCGCENTQVKDSRPTEENQSIRRRRICEDCGGRFTTFERVQLREITVIKRSGRRVPFDREKLSRSVEIALRKRPIQPERIERMVSGIVRQLESMGEQEVPSSVDRRAGDGGAEGPRSRGLRALRLGLSRLPRGGRLPRGAGRDRGTATRAGEGSRRRANRRARPRPPAGSIELDGLPPSAYPPPRKTAASCSWRCGMALRMLGRTAPNPAVGAIIVDEATGEVIARGWTQPGGRPHAEAHVLQPGRRAGPRQDHVRHAGALLASRPHAALRRRHPGGRHPSRRVRHRGPQPRDRRARACAVLRKAGVAGRIGLCAEEARWMAAGHILRMTKGRPFVQLKIAVSGDGLMGGLRRRRPVRRPAAGPRRRHLTLTPVVRICVAGSRIRRGLRRRFAGHGVGKPG